LRKRKEGAILPARVLGLPVPTQRHSDHISRPDAGGQYWKTLRETVRRINAQATHMPAIAALGAMGKREAAAQLVPLRAAS